MRAKECPRRPGSVQEGPGEAPSRLHAQMEGGPGGQGCFRRAPGGSGKAQAGWLGGHFSCSFIVFSRVPCVLRFGSWIWSSVALMVGHMSACKLHMSILLLFYMHF